MGRIAPEALLFQTGYLTIAGEERHGRWLYRLGYPNLEVRQSLNERLLDEMTANPVLRQTQGGQLHDLLLALNGCSGECSPAFRTSGI